MRMSAYSDLFAGADSTGGAGGGRCIFPAMAMIGDRLPLPVLREIPSGLYLDAGDLGEVLLPRREVPDEWETGAKIEVFLHHDSEDRPVATRRMPKVLPGCFGKLTCVEVNRFGAFLDWGLAKDLMVPFREQRNRMKPGSTYVVHVHVDEVSGRIVASSRLQRFLDKTRHRYQAGDKVELMVFGRTELGYNCIVNGLHSGLLYHRDAFQALKPGERLDGYIAEVRPDGKIDLSLQAPGRQRVSDLEEQIISELSARGGWWAIGDHSSAEEIREELGVSKRTFKQTLGALLKKGRIRIESDGIRKVD